MTDLNRRERELLAELVDLRRRIARLETKEYGNGTVDTFLELTDTPDAYAGAANYFVRVNSGTTALTFGTVDWADVYNKPSSFTPATHAGSHQLGSADPVGTATPTANSIPYADANGLLDSWISNGGTATRGKAAFTSADFAVSGGTVSLGATVPRYSGVPTAGGLAYWTGNGTIAAASYGTADVARYSGAPSAGDVTYWTAAGTVASAGFGTADVVRLTATQTLTNKTLTTPTIGSFTNATHNHTNAAGGGTLGNYAYTSGTPTANAIAYWTGAGTVAGAGSAYWDNTNSYLGIKDTTPSHEIDVNGYIAASGFYRRSSAPIHMLESRAMPTTVDDYIEIGNFPNGIQGLTLIISVNDASFTVTKHYFIAASYDETTDASTFWTVLPVYDTGTFSGNNFALDMAVNNATCYLRLRRTAGSSAGTARVLILNCYSTFNTTSTTGSMTAPTSFFGSYHSIDNALWMTTLRARTSAGLTITDDGSNVAIFVEDGGQVGIDTNTPAARLHVLESTLGDEVQRLESTATNDDPRESVVQARLATTNASSTQLWDYALPASTTLVVEATVSARRTGGTSGTAEDGAGYRMLGVWKNVAGTATQIGSSVTVIGESQAAWDVWWAEVTDHIYIFVNGAANNNITWHATIRMWRVGS